MPSEYNCCGGVRWFACARDLVQASFLADYSLNFKDSRTWQKLATVLGVCDKSVYVASMTDSVCDPASA